ncbi:MAG: relaxase/mobilization nuclease domain-containing protein [Eubacteriales bacterium]
MAILKTVNTGTGQVKGLKSAINYIVNPKKTDGGRLVYGKGCLNENAFEDMLLTKKQFGKEKGRQFAHIIQSFHDKDPVTPDMAYEIGRKFVERNPKFREFQVLFAVHTNEEHLHIHYIVNSVNAQNGAKWQCSKQDLNDMRGVSDDLCREYGLSVIENRGKRNMNYGEYTNENSWKYQLAKDVRDCLCISRDWDEFGLELAEKGIELKVYPPNLGDYTVVFGVSEGYHGLKEGRVCSSNKLCGYGDFSFQNINNIIDFNQLNELSSDWDNRMVGSFLESFGNDGQFHALSMTYGIDWKALCWEEIQYLIGKMKARESDNRVRNELIREKKADKERFELLLTCGQEWLEWFRDWREWQEEDDWDR